MFRANRIGTPNIHQNTGIGSVLNFTWNDRPYNDSSYSMNVINAVPVLDFGYSNINWAGAESVPSAERVGLGQQFTVTKPIEGNVVGIELTGHITTFWPLNGLFVPIFGKLIAAASGLLDAVTIETQPCQLDVAKDAINGATVAHFRNAYYKTQVITELEVGATYIHGFAMFNMSGGAYSVPWFSTGFGVRQLNDQQSIGYRDTLR